MACLSMFEFGSYVMGTGIRISTLYLQGIALSWIWFGRRRRGQSTCWLLV